MTVSELRNKVVKIAEAWVGGVRGGAAHKQVLEVYNSYRPLPRGYAVQLNDAYCATFASACWIKAGVASVAVIECSVPKMVDLAKTKGIWMENDAYIPSPGDAIVYDWDDDGKGDNIGYPDHVGIVVKVSNKVISVIEGNMTGGKIGRRNIPVDGKYIRGFILPKYSVLATPDKTINQLAQEVIEGKWGNGAERRTRLTSAGYNYSAVQAEVNRILSKNNYVTYMVKKGDTLWAIARKYGTTIAKIVKDNNIANPNLIYAGQKLKIYR